MSGARTRRQAALAAADETPTKKGSEPVTEQKVLTNGNGEVHAPLVEATEPKENIFLFAPNLIGTLLPLCLSPNPFHLHLQGFNDLLTTPERAADWMVYPYI